MKSIEFRDVASAPNAISLTGVGLTLDGTRRLDSWIGIVEVGIGRTLDLVDGPVARATGQTSQFGATVDALSDKVSGVAMLASEWQKGIAPKVSLFAIFMQNSANGVATYWAMRKHPSEELKRSEDGARAMFVQNVALGAYAIGDRLKESHPRKAKTLRAMGHVATTVGVGYFGIKATTGYFKRALKS